MIVNEIRDLNGNKLIGRQKEGLPFNQWTYYFENNLKVPGGQFKRSTKVRIKYQGNSNWYEKGFKEGWFDKPWYSQSYQSSGERNSMFGKPGAMLGKHHSDETKKAIGKANRGRIVPEEERKSKSRPGELNHFYGKTHSQETKDRISKNRKGKCVGKDNPFYGKTRRGPSYT